MRSRDQGLGRLGDNSGRNAYCEVKCDSDFEVGDEDTGDVRLNE